MKRDYWICVYEDGHIAGLDESSGGYPWPITTFQCAKLWNDEAEANKYASHFKNLRIEKITVEFPFKPKFT